MRISDWSSDVCSSDLLDPVISKLQHDKSVFILADSRTEAGTKAIFGGSNPAAVLYLKREFIEKNPQTVQALVNAFHHALLWLATEKPEDVVAPVPARWEMRRVGQGRTGQCG